MIYLSHGMNNELVQEFNMHMLFDSDGTLVNSFQCVVEKTNLLAEKFNFRK